MKPSVALIPLSAFYSAVVRTRLAAYRRGWLSVAKLKAPVISIGNLTTGGTGKTPLVEWVCRAIANGDNGGDSRDKKRVCVLTRGYGRENPKAQVVVSNGVELLANERESGDEPFLLARNLLGLAAVVANSDRVAAGEWALQNLDSDCFVLDDGFQHLSVARELDVVTIDATDPWGGGSLLPSGRLREPPGGLSRADCVVITRTEQVENLTAIRSAVQLLATDVPVFTSRMATARIRILGGESVARKSLQSLTLGAFCGIGNPDSFFNHLRREGLVPTFMRAFADHHRYTQPELDLLVKEAKADGVEALMTTAKDAIKLTGLNLELPCYAVEVQILVDEHERLAEMIRIACQKRKG